MGTILGSIGGHSYRHQSLLGVMGRHNECGCFNLPVPACQTVGFLLAVSGKKSSAFLSVPCFLLLLVVLASCAQVHESPSTLLLHEITSSQVKDLLSDQDVSVIDVRSDNERLAGKVPGAVALACIIHESCR